MADNYLITGYWGEPHVTSENDRGVNAGIFGKGRFVLPVGEQFRAEYIGNNTIRVYDGKLIDNGAAAGIPAGRYVDLLISETGQGMKRNDIIAFQYAKDASTQVESGTFVVIKGAESAGAAVDPALTQADLLSDNAAKDQMALWRVAVSGASISAPVRLFDVRYPNDQAMHGIVTAGSGTEYTATVEGIKALSIGESFVMIPHVESEDNAPTLNVNGLGAFRICRRISGQAKLVTTGDSTDWLAAGVPVRLTFNGEYWLTDNVKPSVSDLYGSVPIEKGGHGGKTLEKAQKNLQIMPAIESTEHPGCYYRNVGSEQEWINPPMVTGTEYRTTERFRGAPVYTKIYAATAPSNNSVTDSSAIAFGVTYVVQFKAYANSWSGGVPEDYLKCMPTISSTILRARIRNVDENFEEGETILIHASYIKAVADTLL